MINMTYVNTLLQLELPVMCKQLYEELTNIPFYRVGNAYAYAGYLLRDDESQTYTDIFFRTMEAQGERNTSQLQQDFAVDETTLEKLYALVQTALEQLSNLLVTEEAFAAWITFQKEQGDVKVYHQILETLYEDLVILYAKQQLTDTVSLRDEQEQSGGTSPWKIDGRTYVLTDVDEQWQEALDKTNTEHVLNHRNPFADISIREQKFIFGSAHQQFETLGLTTSHTVTKIAKDSESSYLAVQPGFKIRKSRLTSTRKKQEITFDDTLTTEITQRDENIYVYIE